MATHTALMASDASPIELPCCWTHPLVLVPGVLTAIWGAVISVWSAWPDGFAWLGVVIAGVLTLAWISLLAVLWILGCACIRDEGPKSNVDTVTSPLHVDVLRLGNASLGMSRAPGRKRKGDQRDLGSDIDFLCQEHGFDVVVTLLEDRELRVMECVDMGKVVESKGIQWVHFPMRDKWIPSDTAAFLSRVVQPIANWVGEGKRVLVHCNGGKGRTGVVVSSVLMTSSALGNERCKTFPEAVQRMRACRPGMLKNPLQRFYMWHLRSSLAGI